MKNMKKIILVVFLIIVSLSLCSCDKLDELKSVRVEIIGEDTLLFRGKEYKQLENPNNFKLNYNTDGWCWIVDKEIPLLFTKDGDRVDYDAVKDIIVQRGGYYCSVDKYETYSALLSDKDNFNYYKFNYTTRNTNGYGYKHVNDMLSKDLVDIINFSIVDIENKPILEESYTDQYTYRTVYRCDETGFIETHSIVKLYKNTRSNEYGVMVSDGENWRVIAFKKEYNSKFSELFKKYS